MGPGLPWARQRQWFGRGTVSHLRFPSQESVSPAPFVAHLLNGGGAPASSPSSARQLCCVPGHWVQCAYCPRRVQWKLRPQPQTPPCQTGSPKRQGLEGSSAGPQSFSEVVGSEVRDPRLVKRCEAAEKVPRVMEEAAQGPQCQDRGQGGDSLPEDSRSR